MGTSNYLGLDNGQRDIIAPNDREHFSGRVAHLRFPVVLTLTKGIWDFDGWLETSVAHGHNAATARVCLHVLSVAAHLVL